MTEKWLPVPLTIRQCDAVRRAIAYVMKVKEAEADHDLLVQALGSISATVDTEMRKQQGDTE